MAEVPPPPIGADTGDDAAWLNSPTRTLGTLLLGAGVNEFKALTELQAKGWKDERMDTYFEHQRNTADNAGEILNRRWFHKMKDVFREVNTSTRCVQRKGDVQFLDLGCCPGGFTSYILDQNPIARGDGISLEVDKGGHAFILEHYHLPRFRLHVADLTYFQLGPTTIHDPRLKPVPPQIEPRSRDLVVLDGHQLRTQEGARRWDDDRLLISQVIIGLEAVKPGGNIVLKLSRPAAGCTAKLLCMLDMISGSLTTYKPRTMHSIRGTFYAVAKEAGMGVEAVRLPAIIQDLRKLWVELTFGGEDGSGRVMVESDLDFVISMEELTDRYLTRLIELGRKVWMVQAQSLHGLLRKNGIAVDDVALPFEPAGGAHGPSTEFSWPSAKERHSRR